MKKSRLLGAVCTFVLTLGVYTNSQSSTLTFDDITVIDFAAIPDGYGGFDWHYPTPNGFRAMNPANTASPIPGSGYENGIVSGTNIAFGNSSNITIDRSISGEAFNFQSAWLTAAWHDGLNIQVVGKLSGATIYSTTVTVDTDSPTLFTFNYLGIDTLLFTSSGGTSAGLGGSGVDFAMDDFSFSAVPIPPALYLFGSGLLGLVGVAKRKKSA